MSDGWCLVTGGAGFLGSHVAAELLAAGKRVVVVDDLSGGFVTNVPPDADFVACSVCDEDAIARVFATYTIRHVFHLAAYAAEGLSHFIRRFNYTNNVIGSMTLINEAVRHHVECFVFTSSIAVYGDAYGEAWLTERLEPRPIDPYGIAKLAVEHDLGAAHRAFGLPFVIFRPHNIYGERQNCGDPYRNVVGIFMNQCLRGEPMTIIGDGTQRRAFTYVADVAPVIASAPWRRAMLNETFNIGGDQDYSVRELAHHVAAAMDVPEVVRHLPPRDEAHIARCEHGELWSVMGGWTQTSLDIGLAKMAGWVKARGPQASTSHVRIELTAGSAGLAAFLVTSS